MLYFSRLVFVQSILITFKLCSSKVYLTPDDGLGFDLQNSLEFSDSNEQTDFIVVLPNHNNNPVDESIGFSNKEHKYKFIENFESDAIGNTKEILVEPYLSTQESEESDLEISDLDLDNNQKDMLRKKWRSSCDKKAAKTCSSACKNAYKIVCSSYRCKSRMKRDFKKECRRNCKSKFVDSVDSYEKSD